MDASTTSQGNPATTNQGNNTINDNQLSIEGTEKENTTEQKEESLEEYKRKLSKQEKALLEAQTSMATQAEQMKKIQDELAKYKEVETAKAEEELKKEEENLRKKGEFDTLMNRQAETFKKQLEAERLEKKKYIEQVNEYRIKYETQVINNSLTLALSGHELVKGSEGIVMSTLKSHVKLTEGDKLMCTHYKTGEVITLDTLVKEFLKDNAYFVRDTTPSGAGTPKQDKNDNSNLSKDELFMNDIYKTTISNENFVQRFGRN